MPGQDDIGQAFVSRPRERATAEAGRPFLSGAADRNRATRFDVEETVAFMAHSSAIQMERIQAQLDGVVLAAEQVQDKRLEVLERGPEVSGAAVFMEFAVTLILESPLATELLKKMTKAVFAPVIKRRIAAAELRLRASYLQTQRATRLMTAAQRLEAASIADLGVGRIADELKALHQSFDSLGTGSWRDYTVAAVKGARAASAAQGNQQGSGDPSDTPGVRVLSIAQSYAANHRMSARIEAANFELWLRSGLVSAEDVRKIFAWSGLDFGLEQVRDESKRYFEVLIWSMLLWQQAKTYKQGLTKQSLTAPEQVFYNLPYHVPDQLLRYWLYRFINPRSGSQFADVPAIRAGGKTYDRSVAALAQYMLELARQSDKNQIRLSILNSDGKTR